MVNHGILAQSVALVLILAATSVNAADPAGDATKGKRDFMQCAACHTVGANDRDKTGPNLHNLFGRVAGTKPGYSYSSAMKKAGFAWDEDKLRQYIAHPNAVVPRDKMGFGGVANPQKVENIIAYLKEVTK